MFHDFLKYLGVIVFTTFLACSPKYTPESSTETPPKGSLESGLWKTSCLSNGTSGLKLTATLANGSYNSTGAAFSETSCTTSTYQMVETGTYTASAMSSNGAGTLDWTLIDLVATPLTSSQASTWNSSSFCGWTDWTANVTKSLLGRTCGSSLTLQAGMTKYDIFRIEQYDYFNSIRGSLEFGYTDTQHDGLTPATRPISYNGNYIYVH